MNDRKECEYHTTKGHDGGVGRYQLIDFEGGPTTKMYLCLRCVTADRSIGFKWRFIPQAEKRND